MKKPTLFATLGTMLEVYDFLIYSLFANFLSKIFFSYTNCYMVYVETFVVFSVGYFSRPFGGIVIGYLGDKFGRKEGLGVSLQIMAVCTFLISCLPSYEQSGMVGPILLMLLRIIQGIAHGGELPGAIVYTIESCVDDRKSFYTSFIFFGAGLGGIMSTGVIYIITKNFTDSEIIKYAWRIPFAIGGLLSVFAVYFRMKASESPAFIKLAQTQNPLPVLMKHNIPTLVKGVIISILPTLLIVLGHYLPAYLKKFSIYESQEIYFAMLCGMIAFALVIPITGYITLFISQYTVSCITSVIIAFCSMFICYDMDIIFPVKFVLFYKILSGIMITCYPCMISNLFSTNIRYSGVALSYNAAFIITSILLFCSTALTRSLAFIMLTPMLVFVVAIIHLLALYTVKNDRQKT